MAKITYTEPKKRAKEKTDVYADGVFVFTLCDEIAVKYGVCAGAEFDEDRLSKIKSESDCLWAFECGLASICRASTTRKILADKLKRKSFGIEAVNAALDKLEGYGYLDDRQFAENYVSSASSVKGSGRIRQELRAKGVADEIIAELLEDNDEIDAAFAFARKFSERHDLSKREERDKLIRSMQYRGFGWDSITECLARLKKDVDD